LNAGRGFGKTRTESEDAWWQGCINPNWRIALVAATYADARDTLVEGDSGILGRMPRGMIEKWNRSLGELVLTNGTRFKLFASTEPERLRGPQHHRAYCDELAAWQYPETWDQMLFGLRLGQSPKVIIGTTPKPVPLIRKIVGDNRTRVSRGSTFDNASHLAPDALRQLREKYEGTRLGRQELNAEILEDVPGALWSRAMFDNNRVLDVPQMQRIVVAVDPSGTRGQSDGGDSIGISVCGRGNDGRGYVLADRTCKLSPEGWARMAVTAYHEFRADKIIAERNFGGAMVEAVIKSVDINVAYSEVVASRGKAVRAEPVAALYEQGRVSHAGNFDALEDQLTAFTPAGYFGDGSPDRADALVWAMSELMLGAGPSMLDVL
jgi:predicted phage terminase large subunit-like protein